MSNTCSNCQWTDCPALGTGQSACENWTSDPNGVKENHPDPIAALEARINGLDSEVQDLKAKVAQTEMMVSRMVTSMITALADVD